MKNDKKDNRNIPAEIKTRWDSPLPSPHSLTVTLQYGTYPTKSIEKRFWINYRSAKITNLWI